MKTLARSAVCPALHPHSPAENSAAGAAPEEAVHDTLALAATPAPAWAETQPGYHMHQFPDLAREAALDDPTGAPPQV